MKVKRYQNVFDALEDDPAVAQNLKIRSQLMTALTQYINKNKLTQAEAAQLFEVNQPRISDLVRGKIERFTIDMLVNMLARAGKHLNVKISSQAA
jgi:predicted XRE-type DNA-binding protein